MSPNSTTPASQGSRRSSCCSDTSTLTFGQEPFETFQHRAVELCNTVLDKGSPTVERLRGGGFNRVLGLHLPNCEYILRIPRYLEGSMPYDIAPLKLLENYPEIPAPTIITFDISQDNALKDSYMIQERIPGLPCISEYPGLPHEAKCAVARDLGRIFSSMHGIRNRAAGRLIWKEDTLRLEPLDPYYQKDPVLLCNDGPADQSTFELILDVIRSKLAEAIQINRERSWAYKIEFFEKLTIVAKEMEQAGVWDTAYAFCLCHRDIEPRNILVGEGHHRYPRLG
ncbi:hypothetical protein PENDEC_c001G05364 [Penicillium decumbens]|uniref:Aminoglycoside phosphotransferase domain-containing protein n=1 Tax=Penicillium decumbens TaxID=69771 RepID=A0A1V6PNG8_PENDC|nr:hypothetical protein PENDEC_c001G05364 [Penicillium decumbens]